MNTVLLKTLLSRLSLGSFESFIIDFFNKDAELPFDRLREAGEGVFYQSVPFYATLHSVFILQYLPLELCTRYNNFEIAQDPNLPQKLEQIKNIYENKTDIFSWGLGGSKEFQKLQSIAFLTNLAGIQRQEYDNEIMPRYHKLLKASGIDTKLFVGSYDSFLDLNPTKAEEAFQNFLSVYREGISISLSDRHPAVMQFTTEKSLSAGVSRISRYPFEPLFVGAQSREGGVLAEFRSLLSSEPPEPLLEEFLRAHYKDILGPQYDEIVTQLWLRFPESDISGKNRRLDIFLRNSVINDWELFELKRVIPLAGTYRDVPVIAKEIAFAVQQTKNYSRILSQDHVKRKLAREGIEYFEPSLNLVVGRTPQISHKQWRWLLATHDKDVRLITYDQLLKESEVRLEDRLRFLDQFPSS